MSFKLYKIKNNFQHQLTDLANIFQSLSNKKHNGFKTVEKNSHTTRRRPEAKKIHPFYQKPIKPTIQLLMSAKKYVNKHNRKLSMFIRERPLNIQTHNSRINCSSFFHPALNLLSLSAYIVECVTRVEIKIQEASSREQSQRLRPATFSNSPYDESVHNDQECGRFSVSPQPQHLQPADGLLWPAQKNILLKSMHVKPFSKTHRQSSGSCKTFIYIHAVVISKAGNSAVMGERKKVQHPFWQLRIFTSETTWYKFRICCCNFFFSSQLENSTQSRMHGSSPFANLAQLKRKNLLNLLKARTACGEQSK